MSSPVALTIAVVLLGANAFFVGAEFALLSARRSQIEPRAEAGSRIARTTLKAMEQVTLMMAGAQLGITICSLGLGAVGEPAVAHLIEPGLAALGVAPFLVHPIAFGIALMIVVCLHVVLGEMVPKNIAIAGPERSALVLGPPMFAIVTLLRPLIVAMNAMANMILRVFRIEPKEEVTSSFTRSEVAALVEESRGEGLLDQDEAARLSGALTFTEKTVDRVTIAPDALITVPRGTTPRELEELCAATGFSRFPVVDAGQLIGYLHIKDVLENDEKLRARPVPNRRIRPFASVRSNAPLHEALTTLQRRGAHLARVVDDDGSTSGLAALEDVIEELVGEIRDAAHAGNDS
jgi:CBS domain containing-hemolysin-like protein